MSKIKTGFYWVKHFHDGWTIAYWNGAMWFYQGHSNHSTCFTEIDERPIVREEPQNDSNGE